MDQSPEISISSIRAKLSLRDVFIKQSFIVFSASMVGNVCNYLYQIFVGRALGPEAYGVFGALFAIFYLIGVFTGTIQAGVGFFIAGFNAEGKENHIGSFLRSLIIKSIMLGLIGFLLFTLISPWIADFLNISSTEEIIIIGTTFIVTFTLPVTTGALQGMQRFEEMSAQGLISVLVKLLLGIGLICIGFGIFGALGAVALGSFVATVFTLYVLRLHLAEGKNGVEHNFAELYHYSGPVVLVMFCLAVPSNLDVILVKHFFSNFDAGLYVSASVLGKIIYFVSGAILTVMFPKVVEKKVLGLDPLPILKKSLIYTGLLSGVVTAGLFLFPNIVGILFGKDYLDAIGIIEIYAIMMFAFSLTAVIAQYSIAIKDMRFGILFLIVTICEMGLISFVHNSVIEVANILMVLNIVLFIISYGYITRWGRSGFD